MDKIKVAILEDNKRLLKELKEIIEETGSVKVVATATTSEEFLDKVKECSPDAVLLDIELVGDSMTGIDIANELKLPVMFVSGKTRDYLQGIEEVNLNLEQPVHHITKPITKSKIEKILPKLLEQIRSSVSRQFALLDFPGSRRNKIPLDTIVYLASDTGASGQSNNKKVYFTSRKPETLIDFSFVKMEDKGLLKTRFITVHKSYRVNAEKILSYTENHTIQVKALVDNGVCKTIDIPVSENYRKTTRQSLYNITK